MESVGLLLYRIRDGVTEVLLGHMGGPLWASKPRSWSIPKGLSEPTDSSALATAEREFAEEMGRPAPEGTSIDLGSIPGRSKRIHIFARPGDFDTATISSNLFTMEWPPKSGRHQQFPELDRAAWFPLPVAAELLAGDQATFLDRLATETAFPRPSGPQDG